MKFLLDTHLLLWAAKGDSQSLAAEAYGLISSPDNDLYFSAISILEVAIKFALERRDFQTEPQVLRRSLIENGYVELPVTGDHAAAVARLPVLHKDPFDRLLAAQAGVEGITLLTRDAAVARYPGPIRLV